LQAEDGIRARNVTGVQTCALPISDAPGSAGTAAPQTAEVAPEVPAEAERAPGKIPGLTDSRSTDVASEAAPAAESAEEPEAATGSLNVQEILARRRAVG